MTTNTKRNNTNHINDAAERHAKHHRNDVRYKSEEHDAWADFYDLDFTKGSNPKRNLNDEL